MLGARCVSVSSPANVFLRVQYCDGTDVDDVFGAAASGEIICRFGQSLGNRTDGVGSSKPLDKLVPDVSSIELGEDEAVCLACDDAPWRLLARNRWDEGRVKLQFPVNCKIRFFARASLVACTTLSTISCEAEPLMLKLNIATAGSMSVSFRNVEAVAMAMSASCSVVGSGTTAESPNSNSRPSGMTIRNIDETVLLPGAVPTICKAGRSMSPVACTAPVTSASTAPAASLQVAW